MRSASSGRKHGRDFITAYQSLVCLVPAPVERAEIVDHAQVCGGGKIGEAQARPSQPPPVVQQIIDIIEMLGRGPHRLAQNPRVGAFPVDQALAHPFVHQGLDRFAIELGVEPFGHPPDFRPERAIAVDHRHPVDRLVEIFDDRLRTDQGDALVGLDHHRRLARRVQVDELVPLLPRVLPHQLWPTPFSASTSRTFLEKGHNGNWKSCHMRREL